MKKIVLAAVFSVALLAGAGCGGGGSQGNTPVSRQSSEVASDTQTSTGSYRGIDFQVVAPRQVKAGEPVILQFTATNNRSTSIAYDSGHSHNTRVLVRQNGVIMYDSTLLFYDGAIYPSNEVLPKSDLVLPLYWRQIDTGGNTLGPGTYSVHVSFVPRGEFPPRIQGELRDDAELLPYGAPPVDIVVTP